MSTEITIDLSDYLEECIEALKDNGYKIFEDDFDIQEYYEKNFHTGISDLTDYVKEMEKNLYVYSHKEFKSYEEIYNDLRKIVEGNK